MEELNHDGGVGGRVHSKKPLNDAEICFSITKFISFMVSSPTDFLIDKFLRYNSSNR